MALALRCEQLLRAGTVHDYVALANLGQVTQGRITQMMNPRQLAIKSLDGCQQAPTRVVSLTSPYCFGSQLPDGFLRLRSTRQLQACSLGETPVTAYVSTRGLEYADLCWPTSHH